MLSLYKSAAPLNMWNSWFVAIADPVSHLPKTGTEATSLSGCCFSSVHSAVSRDT